MLLPGFILAFLISLSLLLFATPPVSEVNAAEKENAPGQVRQAVKAKEKQRQRAAERRQRLLAQREQSKESVRETHRQQAAERRQQLISSRQTVTEARNACLRQQPQAAPAVGQCIRQAVLTEIKARAKARRQERLRQK